MTLPVILEITVITIISFLINKAPGYEFQAGNRQFLKSIVKEALKSDAFYKRHPYLKGLEIKSYKELHPEKIRKIILKKPKILPKPSIGLSFSKNRIEEELNKDEEVLTESLRMGHRDDEEDENTNQMKLAIELEDLDAIKYPVVVKVIDLDNSIRRTPVAPKTHEQHYEDLKAKIEKRQEIQYNMSSYMQKHHARMQAVIAHISEHFMSSVYIHAEVRRIKSTGKIRDRMRELLKEMDDAGYTAKAKHIRSLFYSCYTNVRPTEKLEVWNAVENNNLIIHYVKDPPNDGKLAIELEDLDAIKYPVVVKVIDLDNSIRRTPVAPKTHEQHYEDLKAKIEKRQEIQYNMSSYMQKHHARMQAVIAHISEHFMSSVYIHAEVRRIKSTGKIRDRMRELLKEMDDAGYTAKAKHIRSLFYSCYTNVRPTEKLEVWNAVENNNLIIHYVKDPPNDGVN